MYLFPVCKIRPADIAGAHIPGALGQFISNGTFICQSTNRPEFFLEVLNGALLCLLRGLALAYKGLGGLVNDASALGVGVHYVHRAAHDKAGEESASACSCYICKDINKGFVLRLLVVHALFHVCVYGLLKGALVAQHKYIGQSVGKLCHGFLRGFYTALYKGGFKGRNGNFTIK